MYPELGNNYVLYNEGEKDRNIVNNVYESFLQIIKMLLIKYIYTFT